MIDDDAARALIADPSIVWYQRFQLSEQVMTPGSSASEIEWTLDQAGLPERLEGKTVLDIGTTNGGAAFIAERRGALRVVAVDLCDPDWFGFAKIRSALGSRAEFLQASVYDLPELLDEPFDVVFFLGVLYHLRHPLIAVDALRALTGGTVYVESAIGGDPSDPPTARFFRLDELAGDPSNWFLPNRACMLEWFESSGFTVTRAAHWPEQDPTRGLLVAVPAPEGSDRLDGGHEAPISVYTAPR